MLRPILILVVAIAVIAGEGAARTAPEVVPGYVIVVHPSSSETSVDRKFLADAFLKKITRWPNGDTIRPVDLGPDAAARREFSDDVLRRSVAAVKSYWQQRILKYPGAIGYVASGTQVLGAKIVNVK
jgi:hypothetical protein